MELSKPELKSAVDAFIQFNEFWENLHATNPAARCIKGPRLPELISESIVYHMVSDGMIPSLSLDDEDSLIHSAKAEKYKTKNGWSGRRRNNTDLIIQKASGRQILIEVKATQKRYTELKEKDVEADYLIWLEFNETFRNGSNKTIELSIVVPDVEMRARQWNWKAYHDKFTSAEVLKFDSLESII